MKDRSEESEGKLRESTKTIAENRREITTLKGTIVKLEREKARQARYQDLNQNKEEEQVTRTYRVRFQVVATGSRGYGQGRPAITKEIQATSFNEARSKIQQQYPGARVVTIEEEEEDKKVQVAP